MSAPNKIWAWCFQSSPNGEWGGWGGYARHNNLSPMDDRERATGAEYIRLDLHQAEVAAARERGMREAAELALQRKGDGTATLDHPYDKGYLAACDACAAAILALIGENK